MTDDERPMNPLLLELLDRGVPWHLAIEAIASTALDREPRVQTHSEYRNRKEADDA